jgi:hypothetical protein
VEISKGPPGVPDIFTDQQSFIQFTGVQSAQASGSILWPPPANLNDTRGQFNAAGFGSGNTNTLELRASASAGGTRIATNLFAVGNSRLSMRFALVGPSGNAIPFGMTVGLGGGAFANPLPGETRALGRGIMGVRADGLLGGKAGDPIGTTFEQRIARSTKASEDSGTNSLTVSTVMESGRAFTIDFTLQASAQFNATADFSNTARIESFEVPLGYTLTLDGVSMERNGTTYRILGQSSLVPEPASAVLMFLGLGTLGFAVRRRRSQ